MLVPPVDPVLMMWH